MEKKPGIDCVFVIPSNSKKSYQKLSETYSAIEPPTWALLLAQSIRSVNLNPKILDAAAENLTIEEIFKKIQSMSPKLICIVVYGQNVNAGTTNMSGAVNLINYLKDNKIGKSISLIGSHAQALPKETLEKEKNEVISSRLKLIKKEFKQCSGRELVTKKVESKDNLETLTVSPYSPHRKLKYSCTCFFEVK